MGIFGNGYGVPEMPDGEAVRDFAFGRYVARYSVHACAWVVLRVWRRQLSITCQSVA